MNVSVTEETVKCGRKQSLSKLKGSILEASEIGNIKPKYKNFGH